MPQSGSDHARPWTSPPRAAGAARQLAPKLGNGCIPAAAPTGAVVAGASAVCSVEAATGDCSAQFPQLPLSELPPQSRSEFCKFASDTLCYCGCPHTIAGCLKEHPSCRHAVRAATLALSEIVVASASADAAAKFVNGYYDSFKAENRVKLPVDVLPCQGAPDASMTLVEFSDFDCPHCKAARPIFEKLVQERHDLRLCFASFPLHKHSGLSAAAAEYARRKGAFWRFHDLLFEDQDARAKLDEAAYTDDLLKPGREGWPRCRRHAGPPGRSQIVAKLTEEQRLRAHNLKIDGTPWVYVNGRVLPPFSAELYQLSLDDEREWIANTATGRQGLTAPPKLVQWSSRRSRSTRS